MIVEHYPFYLNVLSQLPYKAATRIARRKWRGYSEVEGFFTCKHGLEIGGPSRIFQKNRLIPVYDRCESLDDCNFAAETIWGDARGEDFGRYRGKRFVADACDLSVVPDGTYDFVLASHVLEHIANPLRALQEWKRVLAPAGSLLVIVPDKRGTFDRRRAFTSFDHLQADFRANAPQDDMTHLNEILELHDLRLDPPAGSHNEFRERCLRNVSIRAMHHHVFSAEVLIRMFSWLSMPIIKISIELPFHIIVFAGGMDSCDGEKLRLHSVDFLRENADWRRHDPLRNSRFGRSTLSKLDYLS